MKQQNGPWAGVGIMIVKDGKVLLGKRHGDSKKAKSALHGAGKWTMPGGKVHFKEKVDDAAFREVLEETSLKVNKEKLEIINVANDIAGGMHFVTVGFLCRDFEGEPKVMEPDEITCWEWFCLKDLPKPLYFPSVKILRKYKEKF